jgi:hypothetical protein
MDTESRYSTFDCELLAAHAAIKHFCHFCEGRTFQLGTGHKPLVTAISLVSAPISSRQQCHLVFISEFNVQLLYLPGLKNVVADFLSRPNQATNGSVTATSAADPVDFEEMAAEQNCCPEMQRLLGGTSLKLTSCQTGAQRLAGDVSTGNFRLIVPLKFRKSIFEHFHNVAHPGRLTSHRIISSRFVWRSLSKDFTPWARVCLTCQRGKIHHHTGLVPLPIPQRPFSHLHVDLVGPLQYSNHFNYIFTIIDRTSQWMEAIPLSETSAAACAKALPFTWISRFGVPETITSDREPQFTSNLWLQLCEMLNISHKQTTAYHPESNSAVKRLHCRLKDAVHARAAAATWPRSYHLYSLDSEHNRGKTLVFPQLRQFSVHKLSYKMNFCKMMNFQLTPLSKNFQIPRPFFA